MEKYEIEKLRDLPIEEVASQLGLQVARHKSLCPFIAIIMQACRSIRGRTCAAALSAWTRASTPSDWS